MKGCPLNKPIGQYDTLFSSDCFGLSKTQERVIWLLREAGFSGLHVSQPSYSLPSFQERDWHKAGSQDIDFIVLRAGSAAFDSEVMRAFIALSLIWPGGLGIGIRGAAPHLHVDGRATNFRRWIELEAPDANGNVKQVPNWHKDYGIYLSAARKIYGYDGDGGVDWKSFFADRNMTPQDAMNYLKQGFGFLESVIKWSAVGLLAYFGLRAVGLIESIRGK